MSGRVVFWYGCNALRHGDIIHGAIAVLKALGIEADPAGGPGYCCGTSKDGNLGAAAGMARRTVEKFNASGRGTVVTWCPSCHRHMATFMQGTSTPHFGVSHITQILHARRAQLAPLLTRRVERRVVLHSHLGFHEVDVAPLVADLLRLVPGVEVTVADYAAPGHMCSALAGTPAALKDVMRTTVDLCAQHGNASLVTIFHACQRILCGLESSDGVKVINYITLLAQSMGVELEDEYSQWKNAGSGQAIVDRIGPERLARVGPEFFSKQILPELLRRPEK